MCKGSDVGTLAAHHAEVQCLPVNGIPLEVKHTDIHIPWWPLHLLPLAGQLVQLLPLDLDSRVHRRHLLDVPQEGIPRTQQLLVSDVLPWKTLRDLRLRVIRCRGLPQPYCACVLLLLLHKAVQVLGALTNAYNHQPCGHGIQRPGMAHLLDPKGATELPAEVKGRPVPWFVDQNHRVLPSVDVAWQVGRGDAHRRQWQLFFLLDWGTSSTVHCKCRCLAPPLGSTPTVHAQRPRLAAAADVPRLCVVLGGGRSARKMAVVSKGVRARETRDPPKV
mmetsp:Transcript_2746/g.7741  ORF Transcript_2746/g.7741 Transcript_2746/m.7741 type:complete len:276 (+) Transcript_2746:2170-2997(+)